MNHSFRYPSNPSGVLALALCLATVLFSQPVSASEKPAATAANRVKGQLLYTKFSLFYEKNVHRTTNYRKGVLVPANTQVTLVKSGRNEIVVKLPSGEDLTVDNVQKYSGERIEGIFARTFSIEKVDLSQFTDAERKAIAQGEVKIGMSKAAVLVAIGYPPKHKTPTLESDQWRYWRNRFNTFMVHFEDDKVSSIQN